MTHVPSPGCPIPRSGSRRSRSGWLALGGLGFGLAATAWTAVALVAPSMVSASRPAHLQLRTEDPFAPKALVQAAVVRPAPRPAEQQARAPDPAPVAAGTGIEIAEGVRLPPTGALVRPALPVLASLMPLATEEDGSQEALPTIHAVQTVAALPAPPAEPATPEMDVVATGSLPDTLPLPPIRDAQDEVADLVPLPPARPAIPLAALASIAPDEARPAERPAAEPPPASSWFGNRTAIYDISARTVYLPNGEHLEAHSGLGALLDDPGSVHVKNRGATPPHTYDLSPREALFHGVAALRLTPSGGGSVYGRDGLLAHTYMLGPRGDSNGCVSFKDYTRFLRAYRNGEITKLTVVAGRGKSSPLVASNAKSSWWFTSGR